ncbi:MAG: ATP-grasp domain-containing protein [Silicimonas sp.]|nr:ATP-grasp domain-containing protein [Silicimonas sp.]
MQITKLLIANRGEIACRIIRTCRELGIATVAVHSDADAGALHVEMADEAVRIGPAPVSQSYLRGDIILEAAKATGADAIHPGYGFLSENPEFVEAVEAAGLIFVGPSADAIRAMGLKDRAKAVMEAAGVPVVPGYHGADQDPERLAREAAAIGYPVLIKARAGGGGKGMRLVERAEDFAEALTSASREAEASFGDPACLIEKYITAPRHIELQVFGDAEGNIVHLFERDCSLQRRHQKVIEEAPAPGMTDELRAAMGAAAVAAAKAVEYRGAGTVEFIVDGAAYPAPGCFWFMEMNTRLQVEHPVTEAVTGLDLVALQLGVAAGAPLPFAQTDLSLNGHAFEARLYAEDPGAGFLPATGRLEHLSFGGGARIDTGVRAGDVITPHYDPMISKVITHGPNREAALRNLARTLETTRIAGLVTNRDVLIRLARDADFAAAAVDTGLIARRGEALVETPGAGALNFAFAALAIEGAVPGYRHFGPACRQVQFDAGIVTLRMTEGGALVDTPEGPITLTGLACTGDHLSAVENGRRHRAFVHVTETEVLIDRAGLCRSFPRKIPGAEVAANSADAVLAPLTGRVVTVSASPGATVFQGDGLMVIEAMKMEHRLVAPRDGVIAMVGAEAGAQVEQGAVLILLEETE